MANPLVTRFGREFFSAVPQATGVYRMRGEAGEVIYVGKAKVLRDRLRSYTHAHAEGASRKTLRLVHRVRAIEWEVLPDERSALLRENALLRELRPCFNVVNAASHTYLFVHLRLEEDGLRVHHAMAPDPDYADVFGAFKGLGLVYDAHRALLRILWMSYQDCPSALALPGLLTNRRRLAHPLAPLPAELSARDRRALYGELRRFFNGSGQGFLESSAERLAARVDFDPFTRELVQSDLDKLAQFYARCSLRNRRIKRVLKVAEPLIEQAKLDDYMVLLGKT